MNGAPRSLTKMNGDLVVALQHPERAQFVTKQRVRGRRAVLCPAQVQGGGLKFHVGPLQFAKLAGP